MSKVLKKVPKVLGRHVLKIKALGVKGFKTHMGTHLRSSPGRKGAQGSISPRFTGFQGLNVYTPNNLTLRIA